jgi:hypothetical protein
MGLQSASERTTRSSYGELLGTGQEVQLLLSFCKPPDTYRVEPETHVVKKTPKLGRWD